MVAVCRLAGRRLARPAAPAHRVLLRGHGAAGAPVVARLPAANGTAVTGSGTSTRTACSSRAARWIDCSGSLGEHRLFEVTTTGSEHLAALARERRGAFLFGAHLGSFEAMLGVARPTGRASQHRGLLQERAPHQRRAREAEPRARRSLHQRRAGNRLRPQDQGAHRARARWWPCSRTGWAWASGPRRCSFWADRRVCRRGLSFSPRPFGCPVYLTFGLYHEPNRYDLYCEPFAERIELPRGAREAAHARLRTELRRRGSNTTAARRPTTGSTSTTTGR